MQQHVKTVTDIVAGAVSFAGLLQLVHVLLAIPAAIYMCMRCYEWLEKRRRK